MTYFSDFDTTEYYYNDETLRREAFRHLDDMFMNPHYETVPEALLLDLELEDYE